MIKTLWAKYYAQSSTEDKLSTLKELQAWYDNRSEFDIYSLGANPDDVYYIEDEIKYHTQ